MSLNRALLVGRDGKVAPDSLSLVRPGTVWTAVQNATLRPTALPLMGRYADDNGALDRKEAPRPWQPTGNRKQRRAQRDPST